MKLKTNIQNNLQKKILWIPRFLIIAIFMMMLVYCVLLCLSFGDGYHNMDIIPIFSINMFLLLIILALTFIIPWLGGILLLIYGFYTIYQYGQLGDILIIPMLILCFAGTLLILFSFIKMKQPNVRHSLDQ